ncbi:hypothetical protein [Actinomadura miaoliensis]|uniref:Uncharacterized protein n=1 Tax=Actinomadura miaoliensis TaxID=430685 RepID=A0ABP7V6J2_9ACTN
MARVVAAGSSTAGLLPLGRGALRLQADVHWLGARERVWPTGENEFEGS